MVTPLAIASSQRVGEGAAGILGAVTGYVDGVAVGTSCAMAKSMPVPIEIRSPKGARCLDDLGPKNPWRWPPRPMTVQPMTIFCCSTSDDSTKLIV
jgi:hypothetical protein